MQVIAGSDWVIDLGPGAGDEGGHIVAVGPPDKIAKSPSSRTARFLAHLV
jgi:excinuclease ABC subunit A